MALTVKELCEKYGYEALCVSDPDREVKGGYAGDLLSWVMGSAKEGDAWVTIMSNLNIIAVATLCDVACIILSEGAELDDGVLESAQARGVNIIASAKDTFAVCAEISALI